MNEEGEVVANVVMKSGVGFWHCCVVLAAMKMT